MPVIELKDVVVTYGARRALDGVSFTLDGGAVGLLGPNGAGKSTLLKTLLGFKRAASGEVRVFDRVLPGEALTVRQRLGYMPEREVVSPKASAVSFLTYCGQIFGMTRVDAMERAHEVLNYVGLADSRYRPMETYSTGMLQRVKFGQALVHDPRLLLLDEPTNGLDPEGRLEMLELIRELTRKRKVTVLLSSHLLPDIEHVCDRVVVIDRGRVLKDGYIKDLTAPRENQYAVRVRENAGAFTAALERMGCTWEEHHDGNLRVAHPPNFDPVEFFAAAREAGTHIRHFEPVRHRLEEIFMMQAPEPERDHAGV